MVWEGEAPAELRFGLKPPLFIYRLRARRSPFVRGIVELRHPRISPPYEGGAGGGWRELSAPEQMWNMETTHQPEIHALLFSRKPRDQKCQIVSRFLPNTW